MARIFMDGFETGYPIERTNQDGGASGTIEYINADDSMWELCKRVESDASNTIKADSTITYDGGDYALWATGNGYTQWYQCLRKTLPATYNVLFARFNFRVGWEELSNDRIVSFFALHTSSAIQSDQSMQLKYNRVNGVLYLYVNNTLQATVNSALTPGTWERVEVKYDYTTTNIQVQVNGSTVIDYTGTIDASISNVFLGKSDDIALENTFEYYIDDFALNDNSGTVNNTWIGAGVIRLLTPTSDDTNSDFTPSTGIDNYAMVDEFKDDGDTTYNSSTTTNDIDTFNMSDVPTIAVGQTINAVQSVLRARSKDDIAKVAPILISGATTDTGTSVTTVLSDYYDTKQEIYNVDPNTSAQWTETNVNAVKGGYKNVT